MYLRNREARRGLSITSSGQPLQYSKTQCYLVITLDRTLTFKYHMDKSRGKLTSRNNFLRKLTNRKSGAHAHSLRTLVLALCYSCAQYAAVCERSTHAKRIDYRLPETYPSKSGAPEQWHSRPGIKRAVASRMERAKQYSDPRHPLYGY